MAELIVPITPMPDALRQSEARY
jgi:hypothetical protein